MCALPCFGPKTVNLSLTSSSKNWPGGDSPNFGAKLAILQSHIDRGDLRLARIYLDSLIAQRPEDRVLRFLDGALLATEGKHEDALKIYDALIAEELSSERVSIEKARSLNALGRSEEAKQAIDNALASVSDSQSLKWVKASLLEAYGDYEGALRVYEDLYDSDNSTSVIANNLASLLTTVRSDSASLDRAYQIARRLRHSDFPPFPNTYGWIALRRGDYQEALRHLEPAANALGTDPLAQYHLAWTYQALGENDKALERYTAALDIAGDDARLQFEGARQEIENLSSQ